MKRERERGEGRLPQLLVVTIITHNASAERTGLSVVQAHTHVTSRCYQWKHKDILALTASFALQHAEHT